MRLVEGAGGDAGLIVPIEGADDVLWDCLPDGLAMVGPLCMAAANTAAGDMNTLHAMVANKNSATVRCLFRSKAMEIKIPLVAVHT